MIGIYIRKWTGDSRSGRSETIGVVLAAMILAGCSTGGSASGTLPSQAAPTSSGKGPVTEVFGMTEVDLAMRVNAVEAAIAMCMNDTGFEYQPVDYPTVRTALDTDGKAAGLSPDEFRAQFGYGVTTYSTTIQMDRGLGPNAAIRDALPAADRVAWIRQLVGESSNQTLVIGLDNEDLSGLGGCTKSAVDTNFTPGELSPDYVNLLDNQIERVEQDPRVIAAFRDWSTCMRNTGFSYDDPKAAEDDITSRFGVITGGASPGALSPDAAKAITELHGEEVAVAVADYQCQVDNVNAIKKQVEIEILGHAVS